MYKPLISICATVYNNGNRVRASLDSVIRQFPDFSKNFEFVIVDNYSTDNTYEILCRYAKKYKNIHLYRAKCTRGRGRDIALRKAVGKYIFYVDLDTVYYPTLSMIVYGALTKMRNKLGRMQVGIIKRQTLINVGGWRDLQASEDTELTARTISRGGKFLIVPVKICENEIVKKDKFRVERYSNGTYKKIKLLLRTAEDTIRGNGINKIAEIKSKSPLYDLAFKLIYLKVKFQHKKIYRYSKKYNNVKYVALNVNFAPLLYLIFLKNFGYIVYLWIMLTQTIKRK